LPAAALVSPASLAFGLEKIFHVSAAGRRLRSTVAIVQNVRQIVQDRLRRVDYEYSRDRQSAPRSNQSQRALAHAAAQGYLSHEFGDPMLLLGGKG